MNGQLHETLVESSDQKLWQPGHFGPLDQQNNSMLSLIDLNCASEDDRKHLLAEGYTLNSRWLPYSLNWTGNETSLSSTAPNLLPFPLSLMENRCIFLLSTIFADSLWSHFLQSYLNGTLNGKLGIEDNLMNVDGPAILQRMYDWGFGNLNTTRAVMEDVATSLTNYIRMNGTDMLNMDAPAFGATNHYATCVKIQWGWLAFPISLAVITFTLFLWTAFTVRKEHSPIWKDSSLALMVHGPGSNLGELELSQADSDEAVDLNNLKDMENLARSVVVRLDRHGDFIRLDGSNLSSTKILRRSRVSWTKI